MNLAIVTPYPPEITGIGQYGYHISRALAQSGHFKRITVVAGSRAATHPVNTSSPLRVMYAWQPDHQGIRPAIVSNLRQLNPDLVWFNLGVSIFGRSPLANILGFLSLYQVSLTHLPSVVTLHELVELADLKTLNAPGGRLALLGGRLLTHIATHADVLCFTMRLHVNRFSARRPDHDCLYIPIGAYHTPERLSPSPHPELLFFGTLAPYKGLDTLLDAYRILSPGYPNLRLTIAGAAHPRFPEYRENLERENGTVSGVRWLGQVPEAQIRTLFERAQVVVLPYYASTGSSSVLYQSAMWGRALVASNIPEIQTVVQESGLSVEFFKNRDAVDLARAIKSLLDSPGYRQVQVDHNQAAIQNRSPEATCQAYLKAFNLALEGYPMPKRINIPDQFPSEHG